MRRSGSRWRPNRSRSGRNRSRSGPFFPVSVPVLDQGAALWRGGTCRGRGTPFPSERWSVPADSVADPRAGTGTLTGRLYLKLEANDRYGAARAAKTRQTTRERCKSVRAKPFSFAILTMKSALAALLVRGESTWMRMGRASHICRMCTCSIPGRAGLGRDGR